MRTDTPRQIDDDEAPPLLISLADASRRLSISRSTLQRLIAAGELQTVALGGRRLVPAEALDTFVHELTTRAAS